MRGEKIILLFVIGIFLLTTISAICTVTFDKSSYVPTETITASMTCDTPQERSKVYSLNWTNASGALIQKNNGTTPSVTSQFFYQSFIIPTTYAGKINASLGGNLMEGVATANVTGLTSSSSALIITNTSFGGGYIGRVGSVQGTVKDENGRKISGGKCMVSGWSNDETQMTLEKDTFMINGEVKVSEIISADRFAEGVQYAYKIYCYCGSLGSETECLDELGNNVNNSIGSAKGTFQTNTWLAVNTIVDKQTYQMKDYIQICANATNSNYTKRIPMHIYSQVRCSAGKDNYYDPDRSLIIKQKHDDFDSRGINTNTTQMQCSEFLIPEIPHLQGQNSECYASTDVWVLNDVHQEIFQYSTTSSVFNLTSTELNLNPDWQWKTPTKLNSIINLSSSSFSDYNGTGIGNIDLRIYYNGNVDIKNTLEIFNFIANVTIRNLSGELIEHTDFELEFTEESNVEIELQNVDLSKASGVGWWNVTLDFYDFENRQTVALEGISNKTGTFHLAVDCPSTTDIGSNMNCTLTAKVEDSQLVEKEVDFTCYITDGVTEYSSLNFNQMINSSLYTTSKQFLVPSSFSQGTQYVLQCHADYYNLGSRRDSFYDTFVTSSSATSSGGSSSYGNGGAAITGAVTGGVVDEKEPDDKEGISKFIPETKKGWAILIIILLIIIGVLFILLKKETGISKQFRFAHFRIFIGSILLIILLLVGGNYGYKFTKNKFIDIGNLASYSFTHDPLFRGIILITFITLLVIILFKTLNIRMDIKLGEDIKSKEYYQDKKTAKLQHKINREILKHELKLAKRKHQQ